MRLLVVRCPPVKKIRVAVRKRPLNSRERARGESDIVSVQPAQSRLTVTEEKQKVDLTRFDCEHAFHFDATFDERDDNYAIYKRMCEPLVQFVMEGKGRSGAVFAYGQTGSGSVQCQHSRAELQKRQLSDSSNHFSC